MEFEVNSPRWRSQGHGNRWTKEAGAAIAAPASFNFSSTRRVL